jgi:hypothetical protein
MEQSVGRLASVPGVTGLAAAGEGSDRGRIGGRSKHNQSKQKRVHGADLLVSAARLPGRINVKVRNWRLHPN